MADHHKGTGLGTHQPKARGGHGRQVLLRSEPGVAPLFGWNSREKKFWIPPCTVPGLSNLET